MQISTEKTSVHPGRDHRNRTVCVSVNCVMSNITIVAMVLGYIIGGGFLFRFMEAEAEIQRLKDLADKVNEHKKQFLSVNKVQMEAYKTKLMEQTKQYFDNLNGAVNSLGSIGRAPIESKKIQRIVHLVQNMSFLQIHSLSEPDLKKFKISNSKVTDNFVEQIFNTTIEGFHNHNLTLNNLTLWTVPGSILYSFNVITTIGYGNIVPKTDQGKIATIIYAMFGIPLMILCLTNLGALFAKLFKRLHDDIIRRCRWKLFTGKLIKRKDRSTKSKKYFNTQDKQLTAMNLSMLSSQSTNISKIMEYPPSSEHLTLSIDSLEIAEKDRIEYDLPLTLALIIFVIYILVGALFIRYWEEWDYLDSVYFVFITFSTIGFGDFLPGSLNYRWRHYITPICCAIYILFGLVLLSMCFQLIQDTLKNRARKVVQHLGLLNTRNNE